MRETYSVHYKSYVLLALEKIYVTYTSSGFSRDAEKKRSNHNKTRFFLLCYTLCVLCTGFLFRQTCMNLNNSLKTQVKKYETKSNYLLLNSYSGHTLNSVRIKLVHSLRCCDFQYQYNQQRVLNNIRPKVKQKRHQTSSML